MFIMFDKEYGEWVYHGETLEECVKAYKDNCDEDPDFDNMIVVDCQSHHNLSSFV